MANSRFTRWLAFIPCAMIAISASAMASEKAAPAQPASRDVALQADGTLVGRLVSAEGRGIDGAAVTLAQGEKVISRTTTDAEGVYRFADTKTGVYRITAGSTTSDFRVWNSLTSPPGAQNYAAIVEQAGVIRAQSDGVDVGTTVAIGAGISGLVLGIIAIDEANDAEDEAAELRALIQSLSP